MYSRKKCFIWNNLKQHYSKTKVYGTVLTGVVTGGLSVVLTGEV